MPASQPHSHACTLLCCAYFQEPEQEHLSQKSAALPLYATLVQIHPVLSHRLDYYQQSLVGFITIWLSVFETYRLAPYLWLLQLPFI